MKKAFTKGELRDFVHNVLSSDCEQLGVHPEWLEIVRQARILSSMEGYKESYTCSFCGKGSDHVRKMVANHTANVAICDECVKLASSIVDED
jgi:hypothetical protein